MEWLKDRQPQADRFRSSLEESEKKKLDLFMSRTNLGEVFYRSAKEWGMARAEEILDRMVRLPVLYHSATDEAVEAAARLKAAYAISYADAFTANLAMRQGCALIAGDEDFRLLERDGLLRLEWRGA